ncbi:GNAT family N-acetyltransferase [Haladaptatus sp. YSMS36]|uniref:GNAT family N-acetyltransferase n=1 Tax=Haladaptatus sp. YSMS36 TaxID=3033384 RepID=UPI0023E7C783|nr:GNAT family N-acetyltransferase [Haladaptatus sp. YSMS36]
MRVRPATDADLPTVMTILDGAMLEADAAAIREKCDTREALVAESDGRILGALVRTDHHIDAVAVRRARRGQGIGRKLVDVAGEDVSRLTAEFDEKNRPFYEKLGFEIEEFDDGRLRGTRE